MLISEIISNVRTELVEANASFWSDAELLNIANRAERDFVQKTRCLDSKAFLSTVAGQQDYVLPNNFLSAKAIFVNTSTTSTPQWKRIFATSLEKETQHNENFTSSDINLRDNPNYYWIEGRTMYFDPIPSTNGSSNVLMFFRAKPIPLINTTDSINIDDSLSEAIHEYIMEKAWRKEQEYERAAECKNNYEMMVRQGHRYVKKMASDLRNRIDIESNQDFNTGIRGFNPFM